MSQQALDELQEVLKSNDKDALIAAASGFGESFEKQHLYQRIAELQPKKEA